jgi:hypothetical protein
MELKSLGIVWLGISYCGVKNNFYPELCRISRFGSVLGVNPRILSLTYFFEGSPAKTKKLE